MVISWLAYRLVTAKALRQREAMLDIQFKRNSPLHKLLSEQQADFLIQAKSPQEKVKLLIVRDLLRLGFERTSRTLACRLPLY